MWLIKEVLYRFLPKKKNEKKMCANVLETGQRTEEIISLYRSCDLQICQGVPFFQVIELTNEDSQTS